MKSLAAHLLCPLPAVIALALACAGCGGPQGYSLGTHVGAARPFESRQRDGNAPVSTGMERAPEEFPRRTINEGRFLYHEPSTGKSAPFTIGMMRPAADTLIRAQGIHVTRRATGASYATVYVLGPAGDSARLVYLHFTNDVLVRIEAPE
jgi:hypothetical protein